MIKYDENKTNETEEVTVYYDLFDLPTAQHKAGLAGLLMMLKSMQQRGMKPLPELLDLSPTGATILLSQKRLQVLFDDLFDAEYVEKQVKREWPDATFKEAVEVMNEGTGDLETRFVYEVLQPKGLFLGSYFSDNAQAWIELWRSMVWNVLRSQPTARKVYKERSCGQPSRIAEDVFTSFKKEIKQAKKGKKACEPISGSVFIGAQNRNAENVPFTGLPSENFLLHFWHIVTLIFVPRMFSLERGKENTERIQWQDKGYVLVIPEVSHLKTFVQILPFVFDNLETKSFGRWPNRSIIHQVKEGGLEYFYYLDCHCEVISCVHAVEMYHMHKQGHNVRVLDAEQLCPEKKVLKKYEQARKKQKNPIFNRFYVQNLLYGSPWYQKASDIMASYPVELMVYIRTKTPANMPFFSVDAVREFFAIERVVHSGTGEKVNDEERQQNLFSLEVYNIINQYVRRMAERKTRISFRNLQKNNRGKIHYPASYRKAVEKICIRLFLALQKRRGLDLAEYFISTFCLSPQYFSKEDVSLFSQSLACEQDEVKSLALLAVAACSYLPGNIQQ